VRPYLLHALVATTIVVVLPLALVLLLLTALEPDPPVLVTALVGAGISITAATMGSAVWMRRPESADLSFGELMIWGWFRRLRAEDQLEEGTRLLGLDRSGTPREEPRVPQAEQLEILRDLSRALEAKDPYTHGHSQRVERHSYRTALGMGLSVNDIEELRKAASLHDVGKVRVPDRLLRKAGGLTIEERAVVEEHVLVGAWMISRVGTRQVIEAVRHHHERWDGTGYPDGLSGADIPLFARIIAVTDAYDAMTSTRPYRAGLGRPTAVDVLKAEAGRQFDPVVVDAFLSTLRVPVPIAGVLAFLPAPRIARELAVWLKRVGAGSLAPAASTAGAAVFLGAAVLAPPHVSAPRVESPPPAASSAEEGDTGSAKPAAKAPERERRERKAVVLDERVVRAPTTTRTVNRSAPLSAPESAPDAGPTEEPGGAGDVTEPPESVETKKVKGDPHGDKGRDCPPDHPGDGEGEGTDLHCGD
jgi:hypothetical protein